jgi:hypothetical protein
MFLRIETEVVKLVDTLGLGSNSQRNRGSSPLFGIKINFQVYSSVVEQWTFNPKALGSNPSILNLFKHF